MIIDILTLFPKMFEGPFGESIVARAIGKNQVEINIYDLRHWAQDPRGTVDDKPYSGGAGMLLKVDLIDRAITTLKNEYLILKTQNKSSVLSPKDGIKSCVVVTDAGGKKFNQKIARDFGKFEHIILVCGHYEGIDHRVHEHLADEVISIGDYVLTGGELPAMVITDAIVRLLPGVIKEESLAEESHSAISDLPSTNYQIEYPQYTRPEEYKGWKVPSVLLSGDHKKIVEWQKSESEKRLKKTQS